MNVSQADLDLILNSKIKKRDLRLPVRYGTFGERKRCPMKQGGLYRLSARPAYERFMQRADMMPTRARGVLALIDMCWQPAPSMLVTVDRSPIVEDGMWVVTFVRGDRRDMFDRDVYLSRDNDFTMIASRQLVRGDPPYSPPFAEDLRRAREKAREKRDQPAMSELARMRAAHRRLALRKHTMTVETRRQLDRVGKGLDRLDGLLSVDAGDNVPLSEFVPCPEAPEVNGDTEPTDDSAVVSLQPAA